MLVRFWGTRGSIPVAMTSGELRQKLETALVAAAGKRLRTREDIAKFLDNDLAFSVTHTYGGHSPCVQIEAAEQDFLVCDLGSGARPLGVHIMERNNANSLCINVLMSHVHWDHIMGFPFFAPAYDAGATIRVYGCHESLEAAFRLQQSPPCFPVEFSSLKARIEFIALKPGASHNIAGWTVTPKLQRHTGDSYGYRIERGGKTIVYSTDSEHRPEDTAETEGFAKFFRNADLIIFDAMYSLADAASVKEDWGHSSNIVGVELAQLAGAKHLCLFHHEPAFDDQRIHAALEDAMRLEQLTRSRQPLRISAAYDGLEIEL